MRTPGGCHVAASHDYTVSSLAVTGQLQVLSELSHFPLFVFALIYIIYKWRDDFNEGMTLADEVLGTHVSYPAHSHNRLPSVPAMQRSEFFIPAGILLKCFLEVGLHQ